MHQENSFIPPYSRLKLARLLWDYTPTEEQKKVFVDETLPVRRIQRERRWGVTTLLAHEIATYALANPLHLQVIYNDNQLLKQVKWLLMRAHDNAVANRLFPFSKKLWMKTYSIHFGAERPPSIISSSINKLNGENVERLIMDRAESYKLTEAELRDLECLYRIGNIRHVTVAGTYDLLEPDVTKEHLTSRDWEPFCDDDTTANGSELWMELSAEDWAPFTDTPCSGHPFANDWAYPVTECAQNAV